MPGRTLPSNNSKDAPPPVEMWLIFSLKPICVTAAALSPPPMIVVALLSAIACAIAFVPTANAGFSNTPMGPFQMTVAASAMTEEYNLTVSGPMSSASSSLAMLSMDLTTVSMGASMGLGNAFTHFTSMGR